MVWGCPDKETEYELSPPYCTTAYKLQGTMHSTKIKSYILMKIAHCWKTKSQCWPYSLCPTPTLGCVAYRGCQKECVCVFSLSVRSRSSGTWPKALPSSSFTASGIRTQKCQRILEVVILKTRFLLYSPGWCCYVVPNRPVSASWVLGCQVCITMLGLQIILTGMKSPCRSKDV